MPSSPASYNWTEFRLYHYYHCTREKLFAAWATAAGLENFFLKRARFTDTAGSNRAAGEAARAGDTYRWEWFHDYSLSGKVLDVVPDKKFAFTFGSMTVAVSIAESKDVLLLTLHQTEIPIDSEENKAWSHLNCRSCWAHYLTNLKAVLEHGIDLREPDMERADCISIGFVPK